MVRCPVCTKIQIVYVRGPSRTSCYYCGAWWIQSADEQVGINALSAPPSDRRPMGKLQSTTEGTR
jgi:hypothetical protein